MERYFSLGLFRLLPEFRRLEAEAQEHLKEEFALLLRRFAERGGSLRAYSLVGLSAEADLLLFQGAEDPKAFQALRAGGQPDPVHGLPGARGPLPGPGGGGAGG
jgi:chlorite dismutase